MNRFLELNGDNKEDSKDINIENEIKTNIDKNVDNTTEIDTDNDTDIDSNRNDEIDADDNLEISVEIDDEIIGQTIDEIIKKKKQKEKEPVYRGFYLDPDVVKVLDRLHKKGGKGIKSTVANKAFRTLFKEEGYL